jgi:hypothetical protein
MVWTTKILRGNSGSPQAGFRHHLNWYTKFVISTVSNALASVQRNKKSMLTCIAADPRDPAEVYKNNHDHVRSSKVSPQHGRETCHCTKASSLITLLSSASNVSIF